MKLERVRPTAVRVTLHPLELATLVSAARWVVDGADGPLPADAVAQLQQVLQSYDAAALGGPPVQA
jgi:hypothetical protein